MILIDFSLCLLKTSMVVKVVFKLIFLYFCYQSPDDNKNDKNP